MSSRGIHRRSTSQLPLETLEEDPENIIIKGKAFQEGTSTIEPSICDDLQSPPVRTPISASHSTVIPSVGISLKLNFGSVPTEFSSPGLGLEGEILFTPLSPEIVPWFRPSALEYLPTPGFTTPPSINVATTTERETPLPPSPPSLSPNPLLFPFPL
jgi:hypothetical protein